MTAGDKRPRRLETRRRVEQKSQARNPSAGLDAELDEAVARDEDQPWEVVAHMRSDVYVVLKPLIYKLGGAVMSARRFDDLKDAPSVKAPTSVARDAPSSTTTKEPPQGEA